MSAHAASRAARHLDAGRPATYDTRTLPARVTTSVRSRSVPAVVLVAVSVLAAGCWGDAGRHLAMPSPSPAPFPSPAPTRPPVLSGMSLPTMAPGSAAEAPAPQRYEGSAASVEAKVGEIEALGPDRSESATTSLLRSAESASLLISSAAIRGLGGRGCDRVQPLLVRLLDDSEWQRRAWSAKVLGDNGCRDAEPWLVARSKVEPDERVRARLQESIQHLEEGKKK